MSFLDPVFDVFADLGDSIGDFAESDEGKLAAILAAAYLTGGTSLGASGAGAGASGAGATFAVPNVAAAELGTTAGLAGSKLGGEIAAQELAKQAALSQAAGITGAGASTVPTIPTGLTTTGIPPVPDIGTANVTAIQQGAGPITGPDATQLADLTQKGITTGQPTQAEILNSLGKPQGALGQPVPEAATNYLTRPDVTPYDTFGGVSGTNLNYAPPTVSPTGINAASSSAAPSLKIAQGATLPPAEPSAFSQGLSAFGDFANQNKFLTAGGAYLGAYNLGLLDPKDAPAQEKYNGVLTRYKMSPDFQASNAQPNVYKPTYAAAGGIMQAGGPVERMSMNAVSGNTGYPQSNLPHVGYASPTANPIPKNVVQGGSGVGMDLYGHEPEEKFAQGGIAHFRSGREVRGGNLSDAMDFYKAMTTSQAQAPSGKGDPGIYYDMDPDTRYQDALTAAQIRQAKVNKRAYVTPPVAKRPTPMGQLNLRPPGAKADAAGSSLDPEMAAQGGIMHSSLGGYAAGGNPRLLKGPGDGMSDNIPATIAGKQPARLADGEFVIPADVVSHLGNGSTEAGAKRLHEMMNKVRKARTGNQKQGKQINPNKFMPA
jgi:hypothetical protein